MQRLVVIGNGMVGHKFLEYALRAEAAKQWQITTFCEEPRLAYDRVHLSEFFAGRSAEDLSLVEQGLYENAGFDVRVGCKAERIDRQRRLVIASDGSEVPYDRIVLATGSYPFVPPVPGHRHPACFVYRTIEDLEKIRACAASCRRGVVVGGGLLGLECAGALKNMRLETHVVEFAPQLMGVQVDPAGGAMLRRLIEDMGLQVHTGKNTTEIVGGVTHIEKMCFADGSELATDLIVFSAGIRPRDEIARNCGLQVGERGGIVIDESCRSSDPDIYAVGECALWNGRIFGLVAPGYRMAEVACKNLFGAVDGARFDGADLSTKLKLLGVDVASIGDAHGRSPESRSIAISDEISRTYKRLIIDASGKRLLGAVLVGDAEQYDDLLLRYREAIDLPEQPESLILPPAGATPTALGPAALPDSAMICSCNNVAKSAIVAAVRGGCQTLGALKACTGAGTGCGGCVPLATSVLNHALQEQGIAVDTSLCEHFRHRRQDLYHLIRVGGLRSYAAVLAAHGRGQGCEICKPAVASILAACWNEHILDEQHAGLQDTNDRFLANIQRDGTYSVVPRVPGGEITPDKLIVLGQVAKRYDLYTKITGGQRIDLFGARAHQLPAIWSELIEAGFESGHAYGKAVRTVKTCVGSTWCRYGVQDSVGLGIRLEHRYKGLRAPHKLKFAVSGCTRECAEAQAKDVGVIATEAGYNLYVCGNGGMKPRHADLFATDLDEEALIRYVDRFLMFYIRTADRLQRTSVWFENLEGGLKYLQGVVIEDSLGIAPQLEADMQALVGSYQCEWRTAIADPRKRALFKTFINTSGQDDPDLHYVRERDQPRPAYAHEVPPRSELAPAS